MTRIVVYTALFGDYDLLNEAPDSLLPIDYVCITDNDYLKSKTWIILNIKNDGLSSATKNRFYKFSPNIIFPNYDFSVYIDSNIKIKSDLSPLIYSVLNYDISIPLHSKRFCVYDEVYSCFAAGKINFNELRGFVKFLKLINFPKKTGLTENGLIFRRHNSIDSIKWGVEMLKGFSELIRRDQLISPILDQRSVAKVHKLSLSVHGESDYFQYMPHKKYINRGVFEKVFLKIGEKIRFYGARCAVFVIDKFNH